jgi:hypothetical protein
MRKLRLEDTGTDLVSSMARYLLPMPGYLTRSLVGVLSTGLLSHSQTSGPPITEQWHVPIRPVCGFSFLSEAQHLFLPPPQSLTQRQAVSPLSALPGTKDLEHL